MKRITEYENITSVSESDVLPIVDVSDTEQASTGSTRKGTIATIADYLKDRAETLTNKTLTSPAISGGTVDGATISGGTVASDTNVVEVLKKVYPVGCIYTSTVSTNPSILFGFGTWSAFGAGKVMVGLDSTDTDFNTIGKTGGTKTHTLTSNEMPSHKHTVKTDIVHDDGEIVTTEILNTGIFYGQGRRRYSNIVSNSGGGQAHNNLQPYIVTYFWKRES